MQKKYFITIFATVLSIIFSTLSYLMKDYSTFWLSIEVISLPLIYSVGYEMLMDRQKKKYETMTLAIQEDVSKLDKLCISLEAEKKTLKERLRTNKKYYKYQRLPNREE